MVCAAIKSGGTSRRLALPADAPCRVSQDWNPRADKGNAGERVPVDDVQLPELGQADLMAR